MAEPLLIEKDQAAELIAGIEDPVCRNAVRLLSDDVEQFYQSDPSRLQGRFDLGFFIDVVKYDISDAAKLLHGIVPVGYWENPGVLPERPAAKPVDPARDRTSTWLRIGQAHNYCVLHTDKWIGEILFRFFNYAKLKEEVKRTQRSHSTPPPKVPVTPNAPQQPFDLLFMVTAVDDALQLGKAARKALEEAPVV